MSRVSGELLYRAFENVIRNAVRYAATTTDVQVIAEVDEQLTVKILDRGPGVERRRLHTMFNPFERGTDDAGGFGLGLAIALRAIEMHGGRIAAHNMPEGGLMVQITLPQSA